MTEPAVMKSARVAKDPEDYLRRLKAAFANDPRGYSFEILSIDGETKSGMKRYTLRTTIADPTYFDRWRAAGGREAPADWNDR